MENVKRLLRSLRLKQADLARLGGWTRQQVNGWLTGRTRPSTLTLERMAVLLNTNANVLLGSSGPEEIARFTLVTAASLWHGHDNSIAQTLRDQAILLARERGLNVTPSRDDPLTAPFASNALQLSYRRALETAGVLPHDPEVWTQLEHQLVEEALQWATT